LGEKYGVGLWVFGKVANRFNTKGYKPEVDLAQRISLASRVALRELPSIQILIHAS